MLSREEEATERSYDELLVRSETGLGSEGGPDARAAAAASRRDRVPAEEPVR